MKTILIDARNRDMELPKLIELIRQGGFVGIDTETHDDNRHEGLNILCKYDSETRKKSTTSKLIFDFRRTVLCGVSFYPQGADSAYYLNMGHADVENRLSDLDLAKVLAQMPDSGRWLAHNAAFELTVFSMCMGIDLSDKMICTMQMAVSAYGPHEYSRGDWVQAGQGTLDTKIKAILTESFAGLTNPETMEMSPALSDLVRGILAKESRADASWNGFVDNISYGYGLKQMVERFFDVKMKTFKETLGEKAHMGQLTGEEVAEYGADDAYWAVKIFKHLLAYMATNGGSPLIRTFFEQENPMVAVYSKIRQIGMKVNEKAINDRIIYERGVAAKVFRELKRCVRKRIPFSGFPHEGLSKHDPKWYLAKSGGYSKYRKQIEDWAKLPDSDSDEEVLLQVRGPISIALASEYGLPEPKGPNFSHYMPVRTLMYDLLNQKVILSDGAVQSDGEARGKLLTKLTPDSVDAKIIDCINQIAGVEQRMKLYLKPYSLLTDPETKCLYPEVSSMLATRRMGASNPNPMQLAKRGDSTYVRGFFEPDYDDHVIVSLDWSAIELVEIGEFSGDPEFIKAFSSIPHQDLHSGSATAILAVECPGLTEERFKSLKTVASWNDVVIDFENIDRLKTNIKGEPLPIEKAYGYWRTEIGKGANFNYWYSGWLATVGERMGWGPEMIKAATESYRNRFPVAEQWRLDMIAQVCRDGFITLRDGHRYVRYEATSTWADEWVAKFFINHPGAENYNKIMGYIASKIQKRAANQTVNADIQGSCATIAKRSILRCNSKFKELGWGDREARFMIPIHDELVFSVHRSLVADFVPVARGVMIEHPDMFKLCKLDSTPAVGLTFEPWHATKAPWGQIELYEPPAEVIGKERAGKRLDADGIREVVDHLFSQRGK